MTDNWTRVTNPDDPKSWEPLLERPPQFYTIICKGGKIRTAFPNQVFYYGQFDHIAWECGMGASNTVYTNEVIAYQPIDIPDDIIQRVLSNPNGRRSYFAEICSK